MGLDARIGRPMGLSAGLVQEVSDPKFATSVGLVLYGLRPEVIGKTPFRTDSLAPGTGTSDGRGLTSRITKIMKDWFNEL